MDQVKPGQRRYGHGIGDPESNCAWSRENYAAGATGTRIDHLLGNIELLGIGLQNHIPIQIVDERNRIRMIGAGITIEKEKQFGKFVSLIPYTNIVKGLTLTGFKYPLDHYDFRGFCSLGVSNEIIAESAQITFEDGILIVIEARD